VLIFITTNIAIIMNPAIMINVRAMTNARRTSIQVMTSNPVRLIAVLCSRFRSPRLLCHENLASFGQCYDML
jgi:hypothetical protein